MTAKKPITHVMLDLETASLSFNPAIIQIGAICFNIETGRELSWFTSHINLQSCLDCGLTQDEDTFQWLERNIPDTLKKSRACKNLLPKVLNQFSTWLKSCLNGKIRELNAEGIHEPPELAIWSNGSNADAVWIRSAYKSCNMEPVLDGLCRYHHEWCVRTIVQSCAILTGTNYFLEANKTRDPLTHHNAIHDCKHQIKYFVKAWNALQGLSTSGAPSFKYGPVATASAVLETSTGLSSLMTLSTSFSETVSPTPGQKEPGGLLTPSTSYTELDSGGSKVKGFSGILPQSNSFSIDAAASSGDIGVLPRPVEAEDDVEISLPS
jgi:hypothetical protein